MLFGKKSRDKDDFEDPATKYGRMLREKNRSQHNHEDKPSLLQRLFGGDHDSDFVYYED